MQWNQKLMRKGVCGAGGWGRWGALTISNLALLSAFFQSDGAASMTVKGLRMPLWWSLCTLHLLACQGDSYRRRFQISAFVSHVGLY